MSDIVVKVRGKEYIVKQIGDIPRLMSGLN